MEAILKFNLPEEEEDFRLAVDGGKYSACLWELDQHLRSTIKYNSHTLKPNEYEVYEAIRDKIIELRNQYNILEN